VTEHEIAEHPVIGFDLDMTLIDSWPAIAAAYTGLIRDTGTAIDLDAVHGRLGIKLEDELVRWFPDPDIDAAAECYRAHYVRVAAELTQILPGAREALAAVRAAGARTAIVTAKHPTTTALSLRAMALAADELHANVHGAEKADVLRRLRAAVYVGDTPPDMAAAHAAGARAVGVATGSFTAAELRAAGADTVLGSLTEFPDWYRTGTPDGA
jgi:phosphoglycolate phosphatase